MAFYLKCFHLASFLIRSGSPDLGFPGSAAEGADGAQAGCPSVGSGTRHLCSDS